MTGATNRALRGLLVRDDGQEDLCLALYRRSTGLTRTTALVREPVLPLDGDREVHGNATVMAQYVLRAAAVAQDNHCGLVILHSHPGARGRQGMSGPDRDAESSYANLARELTGLPLVGMTLATGDGAWSGRHWDRGIGRHVGPTECTNIRVVDAELSITWNDALEVAPLPNRRQARTISAWGEEVQANLVRRRVLVVGVGSVGLDVAVRLTASGLAHVTVMDYDLVKEPNLDRMIGATRRDAGLRRNKVHVARREALRNATVNHPNVRTSTWSICEPQGLLEALDQDVIFCCVDRPWPRAVLNALAYTDLVPVLDGGIAIDTHPDGSLRNATWRSHVLRPGRPCMRCTRQLDMGEVALDIQGLLDDPTYIAGSGAQSGAGQNVAPLSINVAAALLAQYVSLSVAPSGLGDPGPLQYILSTHDLHHLSLDSDHGCVCEPAQPEGDLRQDLTGRHRAAELARQAADAVSFRTKAARFIEDRLRTPWSRY